METKKTNDPLLLPHPEDLLASVGKESNKTLSSIEAKGVRWMT